MSDMTTRLNLPYILPSQAQKHVTHNEALQRLDATVQMVVTAQVTEPPASVEEGACYLIAANASGDFAGKTGQIAFRQDDAWLYLMPAQGWRAWFIEHGSLKIMLDGAWRTIPLPDEGSFTRLGVATTADDYNRLAVSASASLLTHAPSGGGHQLKINKAGPSETASLLYQSGWSGRAEMGLAGNDAFSIKTSSDGANWHTALLAGGSGIVTFPNRPVVRAGRSAGTIAPADGSVSGFTELAIEQGGFALADTVSGTMRELRVPAGGLYQISLSLAVLSSSGHSVELCVNGSKTGFAVSGTGVSGNTTQSAAIVMALSENDRLTLSHGGTCQLATGTGKTELCLVIL